MLVTKRGGFYRNYRRGANETRSAAQFMGAAKAALVIKDFFADLPKMAVPAGNHKIRRP